MIKGVIAGLYTWLVYGVIEFLLTCVLPLFTSDTQISRWQWPLIGQIFLVYTTAGLVLGAIGGAVLRRDLQVCAGLTLVVAFVANLIPAWPLARSEDIALGVAVFLAVALMGALASREWSKRAGFLKSPWTLTFLLIGGPWMSRDMFRDAGAVTKTAASVGLLCAVFLCAWIFHRVRRPETFTRQAVTAGVAIGALALGLVFKTAKAQTGAGTESSKPNVLLITMDTVRADHVSTYGYERSTTPNLTAFAQGATLYSNALATADFTLPSHASIFTGLYPGWHGAVFAPPAYPLGRPLGANASTVADLLRSRGYWTGAVAANRAYLDAGMGTMKGFTELESFRPVRLADPGRPFYLRLGAERILSLMEDCSAYEMISLRAADVNRRAFTLIDRQHPGAPFFLFLNYMDAHQPYVPPAPFDSMFPGKQRGFKSADFEPLKEAVLTGKHKLSAEERANLISQYDGGIAYTDAEIGKIIARLRETGLYDNTLIIVTSDHGEAFGEHNILEHAANSVYQDQLHVPLIVKYPGQSAGERSDAFVSQVDFMPTILEIAGVPTPAGVQGRSLRSNEPRVIFAEARPSPQNRPNNIRRAVFDGPTKLVVSQDATRELYNLAADPNEEHNLYDSANPVGKALEDRLSKWVAAMPKQDSKAGKLDKSTVERLKSLGYVQ
ncbi:MAG: sulfatase [Bryobacterales bacterium]|nr:sulfatase [Bryobacterales bacterium]MBV9400554.1 sulfatase [Bryobacterales bacterium]